MTRLIVLVVGLAAVPARADEGDPTPKVEIVGRSDRPFALRLRAEAEAAGFASVLVPPSPSDLCTTGGEAAQPLRAVVVLDPDEGVSANAVACVLEGGSGKVVMRESVLAPSADSADEGVVAIRLVELLRAWTAVSQREISRPANAPAAVPPHITPIVATALRPSNEPGPGPTMSLGLSGGVSSNIGGTGAVPELALALRWHAFAHTNIGLRLLGGLRDATVTSGEESAAVRIWAASLLAGHSFGNARSTYRLSIGVGPSLFWIRTRAVIAAPGHVAGEDQTLAPAASATVFVTRRLSDRFALLAELSGDVGLAGVAVRFGDRDIAPLLRPSIAGRLGVEFRPAQARSRD